MAFEETAGALREVARSAFTRQETGDDYPYSQGVRFHSVAGGRLPARTSDILSGYDTDTAVNVAQTFSAEVPRRWFRAVIRRGL